jgi:hypothetical protein
MAQLSRSDGGAPTQTRVPGAGVRMPRAGDARRRGGCENCERRQLSAACCATHATPSLAYRAAAMALCSGRASLCAPRAAPAPSPLCARAALRAHPLRAGAPRRAALAAPAPRRRERHLALRARASGAVNVTPLPGLPVSLAASAKVDAILAEIANTDSGASATPEARRKIQSLATELEADFAATGVRCVLRVRIVRSVRARAARRRDGSTQAPEALRRPAPTRPRALPFSPRRAQRDPREEPTLVSDYRVSYTSSPQAAGGRFRSGLGRALFRTHALYQNVVPGADASAAPVVVNRVEFALLGGIPGAVGLSGPLRAVEPLRVAPKDGVVAGEGLDAALPTTGVRTFQGAVEVAFAPPFLEVAGSRVTLGGASTVRLATTYLDERLRIGRGGFGSLFVFERMPPGAQAAAALPASPAMRAAGWALARMALALFAVLSFAVDASRLAVRAATTPIVGLPALAAAFAAAVASGALSVALPAAAQPALAAAHALCVSLWLGATMWVTVGQGDVLYALMPRHAFARLRAALRPRFLGASVSAGALALFAYTAVFAAAAPSPDASRLLAYALAAAAANLLWAEPAGTRLGTFRDKFEADAGIGAEVGAPPEESKLTPTLRRLNVRIGRLRAASAALTLVTLAALGAHVALHAARFAALVV